jgi:hypothetical protein
MEGLMVATERQVFDEIEAAIQRHHAAGRLEALAASYARGAALYESQGEVDAACFFWTQAYVFALDAGVGPLADAMRAKLASFGRIG